MIIMKAGACRHMYLDAWYIVPSLTFYLID